MVEKEKILNLYFNNKLKQKDIAEMLHISKYAVSRVLTKDDRYIYEKEERKRINKEKHQKETIKIINKKRKDESLNDLIMKRIHDQASIELSGRRTINNRAFRNWNKSIYEFHIETKEYRLKEDMKDKVSYAVPKEIKWN